MSLARTTDPEQLAELKQLYRDMAKGLPTEALPDFGYGPMVYLGDSVYITKSGHLYEDDGDDTETDD